jgi:hypothetical protein
MATRTSLCRYCGQEIIHPAGDLTSTFALIGEFPNAVDVKVGKPFVGGANTILRQELARLGIDIDSLLTSNLWPHPQTGNPKCLDNGLGELLKTLQPVSNVLFFGSECSQVFLYENVPAISGLWMTSNLLPGKRIMVTANPSNLWNGNIGELRLALELFFGIRTRESLKWAKVKTRLWNL